MTAAGYPGGIYPGQYTPFVSDVTEAPCWAPVGATAQSWAAAAPLTANAWAVMTEQEFACGENFMLIANEEAPLIAVEDRFLVVPPDSGFSVP